MNKGILKHNSQGRYEFENGYYFTSGEPIEIFYKGKWIKGRIEFSHDKEDYYFLNDDIKVFDLAGVKAREI